MTTEGFDAYLTLVSRDPEFLMNAIVLAELCKMAKDDHCAILNLDCALDFVMRENLVASYETRKKKK